MGEPDASLLIPVGGNFQRSRVLLARRARAAHPDSSVPGGEISISEFEMHPDLKYTVRIPIQISLKKAVVGAIDQPSGRYGRVQSFKTQTACKQSYGVLQGAIESSSQCGSYLDNPAPTNESQHKNPAARDFGGKHHQLQSSRP